MNYYIDLFSPETYEAFARSDRQISGFRARHRSLAGRVKPGDKLICYMTKLSRWVGVLEVTSECFTDNTPIFYAADDPFVVRFRVNPLVWLPKDKLIPIHDERVWDHLTFTKDLAKNSLAWTGKVRGSLSKLDEDDGRYLETLISRVAGSDEQFELDEHAYQQASLHRVKRLEGEVSVSVPQDPEPHEELPPASAKSEVRESIRIQGLLARIGREMGLKVWIPRNDRSAVLSEIKADDEDLLETLPLNYDQTTLKTIEQIDVLWLRGRAIIRAFEVEHTTSIYSGILRMADLMALQPNMNIKLHIVAPPERHDKVFQEITRPVFSLLEQQPLSKICTYLSYDSIEEIAKLPFLSHMSDKVIEEYEEYAEADD
jgi:hypothetical protein